ncbi:MAG: C25 family cysteine peptidase, partial [Candidatus Thorarchaeota archaeon]
MKVITVFSILILLTSCLVLIDSIVYSIIDESNQKEVDSEYSPSQFVQLKPYKLNASTGWRPFQLSPIGSPGDAHLTISDTMGLSVVADCYGYFWRNVTTTEYNYTTLTVPGFGSISDPGYPDLPQFTTYLEVPKDVNVSIESVAAPSFVESGYDIGPVRDVPIPLWNTPQRPSPLYFDEVYNNNAFFPSSEVSLQGGTIPDTIVIRGRRIIELTFYPLQYNPQSHELEIHSHISVRLSYSQPSYIQPPERNLLSNQFEHIFEGILLDYMPYRGPGNLDFSNTLPPTSNSFVTASFGPRSTATEYLIIVEDQFFNAAKLLAHWKNRTGLLTRIWKTSEIIAELGGTNSLITSQQIKTFIQNAYNNWYVAPIYVLLFGDTEFIPTNYEKKHTGQYVDWTTPHPDHGTLDLFPDPGFIGSDLPYFTVHGPDYLPDIVYGRISVDTWLEAYDVVFRILEYEIDPPDTLSFYRNILSSAYFDDLEPFDDTVHPHEAQGDGEEDGAFRYITWSNEIRDYLLRLGKNYVVHMNYSADPYYPQPQYLYEEGPFPNPPNSFLTNYDWISSRGDGHEYGAMNISANINAGRFLVYHFDHGSSKNFFNPELNDFDNLTGWYAPRFNSSDISRLSNYDINGNLCPLVISISCNSGWFDGETDQSTQATGSAFTRSQECISELLLRHFPGGAIATVGSSRLSYNGPGMSILSGMIHAFWPDGF